MYQPKALREAIGGGKFDGAFSYLYGEQAVKAQRARYQEAVDGFCGLFGEGRQVALFSAPGRTEVGGNHTDHQRGRVLAAGVNLDAVAVAAKNGDGVIRVQSKGYPRDEVDLSDLSAREGERNRACALVRGVAARFRALGLPLGGLDAYTTSDVLGGSGLSSSAAFEVLLCAILSGLYGGAVMQPVLAAQVSQYAESVYFGKPCGLMDQTASAVGGFVAIDFENPAHPLVEQVDFDFAHSGYTLCIVDTKGCHADLTGDYADIPAEMRQVAALFGKEVLRQVPPAEFYGDLGRVYAQLPARAVARAIHFFGDNDRVPQQVAALRAGDFETFKALVIESGRSSAMYLQNLFSVRDPQQQGLTVALALSERLLAGKGAWRVHGGGFAGTIQAFVPNGMVDAYRDTLEAVYGAGSCHMLQIRPIGLCAVHEGLGK